MAISIWRNGKMVPCAPIELPIKKDHALVAVVSDVTDVQAAQIVKEIMKAKNRYAPTGRGTIATGKKEDVGLLLQKGKQAKLQRK